MGQIHEKKSMTFGSYLCPFRPKYWTANWFLHFSVNFLFTKISRFQKLISVPIFSFNLSGLGIRSFTHCSFAHLLIRSFCSNQMSNCERFTQIAQDKWATLSEALRSLWGNEWPWANCSGRSRQMSDHERFAQVA